VRLADVAPAPESIRVCGVTIASDQTELRCQEPESDLQKLARLPSLTRLELETAATDLTPLGKLTKLEVLDLSASRLSTLAFLAPLSKLRGLRLRGDFNRATGPKSFVAASQRPTVALEGIERMKSLELVFLAQMTVGDISPLCKLAKLEVLDLSFNVTATTPGVAALQQCTKLAFLNLASWPLTDLAPLSKLEALMKLEMSDVKLLTVEPLATLPGLRNLRIERSTLKDEASLAKLIYLEILDLTGTNLQRYAAALGEHSFHLRVLNLTSTELRDLSPLAKAPVLERLVVGDVAKQAPVQALRRLKPQLTIDVTDTSNMLEEDGFWTWFDPE